ncbi:MAG TPA: adenosylcobinamide-phosphate synthase CbiB [Chloroflexota bacterium]|nr:adenosylcobinamide-phosphate synthase CbiB [Chloroflexota bacterium]
MTWLLTSRAGRRFVASALGIGLDRLFGEPCDSAHPLRAFGALMAWIQTRLYRDSRLAGLVYTASGLAIGLLAGWAARSTALALYLACGGRALAGAALTVEQALARADLTAARAGARSLVGRDVANLQEPELARAAVESVAENTVDAVIAPLLYAALAGAPGALGYRAINTLDALVGYHNARYERFGWASARLDDLANYLPARLTALLVALVRPGRARDVLRIVRRDAPGHPSPNAGVAEAAFAAALDLRLGGTNSYGGIAEERSVMGDGRAPQRADIARAVRLSREVATAAAMVALATGLTLGMPARGRAASGWLG